MSKPLNQKYVAGLLLCLLFIVFAPLAGYAADPVNDEQSNNSLYVLIDGQIKSSTDKLIIDNLGKSIEYMNKLWEVKLSKPVKVGFYMSRVGFENGLKRHFGVSSQEATEYSKNTVAIAINDYILINKDLLIYAGNSKYRSSVVCHEIVHIFQHDQALKNPKRQDAYYLLKEAYAYLVPNFYMNDWETQRSKIYLAAQKVIRSKKIAPRLSDGLSSDEYLSAFFDYGFDNFKAYLMTMADFLLSKSSHKAFATYFGGGPENMKPGENPFTASFGITPEQFEKEFAQYLRDYK